MADDKSAAVEEKVVEETTQDSSPKSEGETAMPQTTQEPEVEPKVETEEVADSEVEMTEEQRKAFQRMRLENKKLKEEIQSRQKSESAFSVFRPKPTAQGVDINRYVDPNTGNVDWVNYNNAVVNQAQAAASQTVQEQLDEERARQAFPDVFKNSSLEQAVAGRWFAAKLQGKDVSVYDIAKDFSELVVKEVSQAEKKAEKRGAEQALNELTPKEVASLQAQGQSSAQAKSGLSLEDEENLRLRARRGDENALAQLMKGVSWKK